MVHDPLSFMSSAELLRLVREGAVEAVRREVERCKKAGLPLYVWKDGRIQTILPESSTDNSTDQ